MLVLLIAGIVTTDLVTSSSLRSFLYGRLDEQIDVAQDTAYSYIEATYLNALAAGVPSATTDEKAWLGELSRSPDGSSGNPSSTCSGLATTANTIPTQRETTPTSTPVSNTAAGSPATVG